MKMTKPAAILTVVITLAAQANAQLQFTGVRATVENAIQLYWQSDSNALYEIDYADQLVDASLGGPVWTPLYTDYPSHGTNTFAADAGNYDQVPSITHPKNSPMRFYRVVLTGANTGDMPIVAISSPGNGAVASGSLTVSVNASSTQMLVDTRLYVDGEEQFAGGDGTNFVIN